MYAIAKPGDTRYQVRPDERANLITIPAQTNLVFLKYSTPIRALSHDRPLSRLHTAYFPWINAARGTVTSCQVSAPCSPHCGLQPWGNPRKCWDVGWCFKCLRQGMSASPLPQTEGNRRRDRRTEPRQETNYPTMLRSEPAGIGIIRVLDVSTSGLRVSAPFRLDLQSEVEIRVEGTSVVGVVGNCGCIGPNEFHVGIEIPNVASTGQQFSDHLRLLRARL